MPADRPADPLAEVMARLGEHADQLGLLRQAIAERDAKVTELWALVQTLLPESGGAGAPVPTPRWHALEGRERAAAIARLVSWVGTIYRPLYGHLAAMLGDCWPEHPMALVIIDHLSETWAQLFERPRTQRILSLQTEFQARILPVLAEQLRAETGRCTAHVRPRATS